MLQLFRRLALASCLIGLSACASSGIPSDAKTTVLSFEDLDCSSCGDTMARELIQVDGVYKTAFNKRKAELTVIADPTVHVLAIAEKKKPAEEEWKVTLGAGKGRYKAWESAPQGADVQQVAKNGEDVADLTPHIAKGKVTIVDFSAPWCEPCRELDAYIVERLKVRKDVAYRKLDIGDWDTPLAKRFMKEAKELPFVIVYDKNGNRFASLSGLDTNRLDETLVKAGSVIDDAPPSTEAAPATKNP
ncbi:MAG: thioredoxin family protein [Polyangiaceae bacterium]|nr:thioredoxin family protein [Polyangiaceae bacterium]